MPLKKVSASTAQEAELKRELPHLYKRLSVVNELIRAVERYDQDRPKPEEVRQEKKA